MYLGSHSLTKIAQPSTVVKTPRPEVGEEKRKKRKKKKEEEKRKKRKGNKK